MADTEDIPKDEWECEYAPKHNVTEHLRDGSWYCYDCTADVDDPRVTLSGTIYGADMDTNLLTVEVPKVAGLVLGARVTVTVEDWQVE